ncbi:MAG TPA: PQQ-binding-like beta-propeller repeat protein, partial [Acidobacteriota bacterium]|nr:PQQ-binding-like beta-propeller repeat protein [Acidobacteriota bacterium]
MSCRHAAIVLCGLTLAACAVPALRSLVDPFPLQFPLVEAGSLEIEGRVVGQPQFRDGVITFATDDGFLTAAVVPSQAVLWRRAGSATGGGSALESVSDASKEPIVRSNAAQVQAFDGQKKLIWDFKADGRITADPALIEGRIYFGTENRWFYCLKAETGKAKWRRRLQGAP